MKSSRISLRTILLISLLVIGAMLYFSMSTSSPQSQATLQSAGLPGGGFAVDAEVDPSTGLDIDGTTDTITNGNFTVAGNITIRNGGSLTITNSKLWFDLSIDGEYNITVRSGSSLTIETGSWIRSLDIAFHFIFIVESGGSLVIDDSIISDVGYEPEPQHSGIWAENPSLFIITDSVINATYGGFYIVDKAVGVDIQRNNITSSFFSGITFVSTNSSNIEGNRIVTSTVSAISTINSSSNVIQENFVQSTGGGGVGIKIKAGSMHTISRNIIDADNSIKLEAFTNTSSIGNEPLINSTSNDLIRNTVTGDIVGAPSFEPTVKTNNSKLTASGTVDFSVENSDGDLNYQWQGEGGSSVTESGGVWTVPNTATTGVRSLTVDADDENSNNYELYYEFDMVTTETDDPFFFSVPEDIEFNEATTGQFLSWNVTDDNAGEIDIGTYTIEIDDGQTSSQIASGIWFADGNGTSWWEITIDLFDEDLAEGSYVVNLTVLDDYDNPSTDLVNVNITDLSNPSIDVLAADMDVELGSSGNALNWTASDLHPDNYAVFQDNVEMNSSTWTTDTAVLYNVDGLALGEYNFTIVFFDDNGNQNAATAVVTVVDTTLPTLTEPQDAAIAEDDTGTSLEWNVTDASTGTYAILIDGEEAFNGTWTSGDTLNYTLDDLPVGDHNLTLVAQDLSGNTAVSTVIVTVTPEDEPIVPPTTSDGPIGEEIPFLGQVLEFLEDNPVVTFSLIGAGLLSGTFGYIRLRRRIRKRRAAAPDTGGDAS